MLLYLLVLTLEINAVWLIKTIFSLKLNIFLMFLLRKVRVSPLSSTTNYKDSTSFIRYCYFFLYSGSSLLLFIFPCRERNRLDLRVFINWGLPSMSLSHSTSSRGSLLPDTNSAEVLMDRMCWGSWDLIMEEGSRLLGATNFLRILISYYLFWVFS